MLYSHCFERENFFRLIKIKQENKNHVKHPKCNNIFGCLFSLNKIVFFPKCIKQQTIILQRRRNSEQCVKRKTYTFSIAHRCGMTTQMFECRIFIWYAIHQPMESAYWENRENSYFLLSQKRKLYENTNNKKKTDFLDAAVWYFIENLFFSVKWTLISECKQTRAVEFNEINKIFICITFSVWCIQLIRFSGFAWLDI